MVFFSMFGMRFLKGKFYSCSINEKFLDKVITSEDCFDYGGDWVNNPINFDNFQNSLLTLFMIATSESWSLLMLNAF